MMHTRACLRPSWRVLQLLTVTSILLCIGVVYAATWSSTEGVLRFLPTAVQRIPLPKFPSLTDVGKGVSSGLGGDLVAAHPIEQLMVAAEKKFNALLNTQATSLEDAAAKYRKRRGRHPPPGFDAWYNYASETGAVMVEKFWDQIYSDLGPFWGVPPQEFRAQTRVLRPRISIRGGVVNATAINKYTRLTQWMDMLQSLSNHPHVHLPDVDIPLNVNDEPAMLVPWETIDTALSIARPIMLPATEVLNEFSSFDDTNVMNKDPTFAFDPEWFGPRLTYPANSKGPLPIWSLIQPACHPHSPGRLSPILTDIWHPQGHTSAEHSTANMLPTGFPNNTLGGYASNWTMASDPCGHPALQGLHGAFVAPLGMSVTTKLFPLFGASKFSASNEILLPPFGDWNTSLTSPIMPLPWERKESKLHWRGPALGGHNTKNNWPRFHRHRFVSMLNASEVEVAEGMLHAGNESTVGLAHVGNFRLLPGNEYALESEKWGRMAEWVAGWADVGFTDLLCDTDWGLRKDGGCDYNGDLFSIAAPDKAQVVEGRYKYTAVLDGDSGDSDTTFINHLSAGTVVLKASIYKQWYDSRITPWLHFVPMDNTFVDMYGIMEFFLGSQASATSEDYPHLKVEAPAHEHHFHNTNNEIDKRQKNRIKRKEDSHDETAMKISRAGQEWAEKVLRKEDMLLYMYRLVLEYARIIDDRRAGLGWVGDLLKEEEK